MSTVEKIIEFQQTQRRNIYIPIIQDEYKNCVNFSIKKSLNNSGLMTTVFYNLFFSVKKMKHEHIYMSIYIHSPNI